MNVNGRLLGFLNRVGKAVQQKERAGEWMIFKNYSPAVAQTQGRHQFYRVDHSILMNGKLSIYLPLTFNFYTRTTKVPCQNTSCFCYCQTKLQIHLRVRGQGPLIPQHKIRSRPFWRWRGSQPRHDPWGGWILDHGHRWDQGESQKRRITWTDQLDERFPC